MTHINRAGHAMLQSFTAKPTACHAQNRPARPSAEPSGALRGGFCWPQMAGADAPAGRSRVLAGQQPAGMAALVDMNAGAAAGRAPRAPTARPALL